MMHLGNGDMENTKKTKCSHMHNLTSNTKLKTWFKGLSC